MDPEQVTAQLVRLGLTGYEAKAYVALTGRESFAASELARVARLPRQRIYDVLGSLVEKGLVSTRPGRVVKYGGVDPRAAVGRLLDARREQVRELETHAQEAINSLAPAYRAGREHTDPLQYIEVLRDRGAINARFDELQAAVREEILVFTKPPYAKAPQENLRGLSVARLHQARGLYEYSLFEDEEATAVVRLFIDAGERARFVPELPLKLAIIDESVVMFGMQDPVAGSSDLTIVVVEHPSLATVLKRAFEAYWEQGFGFEAAQAAWERLAKT